jgi:hypothetical protein
MAPLVGNESTVSTWSAFAGGGIRLTTFDIFSLAPAFGLLYSHSSNSFSANNDFGRLVLSVGRFVVDVQGLLWKVEYIGVGARYFWGDKFSGVSYGFETSLKF